MTVAEIAEGQIYRKNQEKKIWMNVLEDVLKLHDLFPLSDPTLKEVRAKLNSAIAQCDISINSNQKVLKKFIKTDQ